MLLKDKPNTGGGSKSFREERLEFRQRIIDTIYDLVPIDVVEHLGNANKEVIFAMEGILDGFVKRIDDRIERAGARRAAADDSEDADDDDKKEE